jgi:hypothetical protein
MISSSEKAGKIDLVCAAEQIQSGCGVRFLPLCWNQTIDGGMIGCKSSLFTSMVCRYSLIFILLQRRNSSEFCSSHRVPVINLTNYDGGELSQQCAEYFAITYRKIS